MKSKLAILSFVLSLIPTILFFIGAIFILAGLHIPANNFFIIILAAFLVLTIPLLISGIILGIAALKKISNTKNLEDKKLAIWGIILGIVDVVLYLIFIIYMSSTIIID